ncbi:hypothetical protein GOV03_02065 [Candidatus Woesearchaeota archaeon]|nr:hypothetical protein [Candidatus Woesearchaeota archaeon]
MVTLQGGLETYARTEVVSSRGNNEQIEQLTDHLSDIIPGRAKTKIEVLDTPNGKILRKTYLPGQEQFFEREEEFNLTVERTGFSKKQKLISINKENKIVDLEYVDGMNLELALLNGKDVDFHGLIDFFLEEQAFLRNIPPLSGFVRNTYFSEVKRLLNSEYLDKRRTSLLDQMLAKAEHDPVVQRFDTEMSNYLWTPRGIVAIDYAAPNAEHPIHVPLYMLTHFDRPKKKAFFEIQKEVTDRFYSALVPKLNQFFNGSGDVEATIKCALLDQFAENFVYGVNEGIQSTDNLNPSYGARMRVLRNIIDYSAEDILKGKVRFRYETGNGHSQ